MDAIINTSNFLKNKGILSPTIGIVLGTGLNDIIEKIEIIQSIPYQDIPSFPLSTVEFHKGNLIYGKIGGTFVLVMQGRFHAYEGYTMQEIVFPIRVMKTLGVKYLFITNAAGGINLSFKKGDLVLIDDHINLQGNNPLVGNNIDALGPRFPDMSSPYDKTMRESLLSIANRLNIPIKQGVYASVLGPLLETRAEYRFLKIIGADLVGMSTVPEVIAANHMGLPCIVISVVTDACDPDNLKPVDISEIIAIAEKSDPILSSLLIETIQDIT